MWDRATVRARAFRRKISARSSAIAAVTVSIDFFLRFLKEIGSLDGCVVKVHTVRIPTVLFPFSFYI